MPLSDLPSPPDMTRRGTLAVMVACLATLLLGVLDTNIVTTAAVSIAGDLQPIGGASQVPWLVTAYVLAGTVVQPLYGKLADALGVKRVFLTSVGLFLLGSLLCGLATSLPELVAFRGLQGLGGGGLMSVTMVVIGQLRAEDPEAGAGGGNAMAGLLVGFGLICGPLLGGTLISHLDWRWIFFVNIPLGLAAWLVIARSLHLPATESHDRIDVPSSLLVGAAACAVLLGCEWGGRRFAWLSLPEAGLAVVGALAAIVFVARQRTSAAPFFPTRLLRDRTVQVISALQLATGIGMMAGMVYITLELQLVRGFSPFATGIALIPVAVGMGGGALAGGMLLRRGMARESMIGSGALAAGSLAGLGLGTASTPMAVISALLVLFGAGVGLGLGNEIIIVQSAVRRSDLGVATTGIRFVESVGSSVGAAAMGLLFSSLVGTAAVGSVPGTAMHAIDVVYVAGAAVMAVAAVIASRLPRRSSGRVPVHTG